MVAGPFTSGNGSAIIRRTRDLLSRLRGPPCHVTQKTRLAARRLRPRSSRPSPRPPRTRGSAGRRPGVGSRSSTSTAPRRRSSSTRLHRYAAPDWTPDGAALIVNGGGKLWRLPASGGTPAPIATGIGELDRHQSRALPRRQVAGLHRRVDLEGPRRRAAGRRASRPRGGNWSTPGRPTASGSLTRPTGGMDSTSSRSPPTAAPSAGSRPTPAPTTPPIIRPTAAGSTSSPTAPAHRDIWRIPATGAGPRDAKAEQITGDDRDDAHPRPSPDGKWLIYLSYPPRTRGNAVDRDVLIRRLPLPAAGRPGPGPRTSPGSSAATARSAPARSRPTDGASPTRASSPPADDPDRPVHGVRSEAPRGRLPSPDADRRRDRALPVQRDEAMEVSPGRLAAVSAQPRRDGRGHLREGGPPGRRPVPRQGRNATPRPSRRPSGNCGSTARGTSGGPSSTSATGPSVSAVGEAAARPRRRLGDRQLRHDPRRDPPRPRPGGGLQLRSISSRGPSTSWATPSACRTSAQTRRSGGATR